MTPDLRIKFVDNPKKATRFTMYEHASGLAGALSNFYTPFGWFEARYDSNRKVGNRWSVMGQFREDKGDNFSDEVFVRMERDV